MHNLAEILEEEFTEAVEVKDKKSLHRYITLLVDNVAEKQAVDTQLIEINHRIEMLIKEMKIGFENMDKRFTDLIHYTDKRFEDMNKHMDKRFEGMDKRFEDMNKKINILIWVISLWMGLFSGISLVLKFIK